MFFFFLDSSGDLHIIFGVSWRHIFHCVSTKKYFQIRKEFLFIVALKKNNYAVYLVLKNSKWQFQCVSTKNNLKYGNNFF